MTHAVSELAKGQQTFYALVWQKVNRMSILKWCADSAPEEIILEADEKLSPPERKAEALRLRSEFILSLKTGDTVFMELGGVGNAAALMLHYRGVRVMRIPPKRLKDARVGNDKAEDSSIMRDLALAHPDWFYEMTQLDALIAELKERVHYLYTMQRQVRIPMTLRLIAIERDRLLIDLVKQGKDPSILPTADQIADAVGVDPEEANAPVDPEEEDTSAAVSMDADSSKASKPRKGKISPETAAIIELLKEKLANNPNLCAAIEQEKVLEKEVARLLNKLSVWHNVFEPIDGIGPRIGGRLIAFLVDPRRFEGKTLWHSCGNMMAYCGWTVAPDGRAQRMRRDTRLNYHVEIRQALFNWWTCVIKLAPNKAKGRAGSPWRLLFDMLRQQQRDGWTLPNGERVPSYAEKRTRDILGNPQEISRFVEEAHLRKRLNKALVAVLGEDSAKEYKSGRKDKSEADAKLFAFLTDASNTDQVRAIFLRVYDPDEWKTHVLRRAMRKLIKHLLTLLYHEWCKLVGAPYDQSAIDLVCRLLTEATNRAGN